MSLVDYMHGQDTLIKSFQYTKKKEKKIKTQGSDIVLEKNSQDFHILSYLIFLYSIWYNFSKMKK